MQANNAFRADAGEAAAPLNAARWVTLGGIVQTFRKAIVISSAVLVTACANPLNQVTSDRYSQTCHEAERNRQLEVAEQACYRALVNVDWGNLGEVQKSQKMYDLARIKRYLKKFDEAEKLFKDALTLEEKQTPPSNEKIGRRLAELTIVYGEQERFQEGLPYVERLLPFADLYQGSEKKTVATIFFVYSQEITKQGELTNRLSQKAVEMGFDPTTYKK